jgi:hypothetical protein
MGSWRDHLLKGEFGGEDIGLTHTFFLGSIGLANLWVMVTLVIFSIKSPVPTGTHNERKKKRKEKKDKKCRGWGKNKGGWEGANLI